MTFDQVLAAIGQPIRDTAPVHRLALSRAATSVAPNLRGILKLLVPMVEIVASRPEDDLETLDQALTELAAEDELAANVVELRYFAGLGHEQIAEITGVSVYEARKKWTYARAWLRERLSSS